MKHIYFLNLRFTLALVFCLFHAGCGLDAPSGYALMLPQPPEAWVSLLGAPHWRLEWLDSGGNRRTADILPGETVKIELPVTWTNPVTAWPYWPAHGLIPGLFRPAGALFPFDVSGEDLCLSWEAGPDSIFYWELVLASVNRQSDAGGEKTPANFDWPRFRELFEQDGLSESVRADPWLVDWRSAAEKTFDSTFDRRRLVPESVQSVEIPVPEGPWYGTSPFADPLFFPLETTPIFPVRPGVNVWFSAHGILRCNGKTWVFGEWGVGSRE